MQFCKLNALILNLWQWNEWDWYANASPTYIHPCLRVGLTPNLHTRSFGHISSLSPLNGKRKQLARSRALCIAPPLKTKQHVTTGTLSTSVSDSDTWLIFILSGNMPSLLLGDFNIHIDSTSDSATFWLLSLTASCSLCSWADFPTYCHGSLPRAALSSNS